jgi:glutaredoxin
MEIRKMNKLILFTSKTCVNCPAEKEWLKENNIKFKEIDVHSNEFEDLQLELLNSGIYVMFVPLMVRKNDQGLYMKITREDLI